MRTHRDYNIGVVCVVAILLMGASGCGTSTSSNVVARVGHSTISKKLLSHWIAIQAVTDFNSKPTTPIPPGVIPDPPKFTACIEGLRPRAGASASVIAHSTTSQLKIACEQKDADLRSHVLSILISFAWLREESAAQGVKVTAAETESHFNQYRSEQFTSVAEYNKFLKATSQSLADEWLREQMDLYSIGLTAHYLATGKLASFVTGFAKRWAAKTTCTPGYVVQNCKESPAEPEARL